MTKRARTTAAAGMLLVLGGVASPLALRGGLPAPAFAAESPTAEATEQTRVVSPPEESREQSRILDGVVAVVDGDPITLRELKRYGITGAPFLPPDVRSDFRALLDSMIEHKLMRTEFEKNSVVATDAMVDRYIKGVLEESNQTRASLELDITKAGISWKDYYERMREEVQRIQLVNLLIRSRVNIPEEEVRNAWESDPQFLESEKLEVGAIFLPVGAGEDEDKARANAAEVQREAKKNFEGAARKHSKLPGADEGGRLGEFKRGTMAAHFEKALKGLEEGDVSEPVEAGGGFYIVKLIDIKSSARRPFEEVKEKLTDKLYEQRLGERFQKWANEDLRKEHRVDILVDRLALSATQTEPVPAVRTLPGAHVTPTSPATDDAQPAAGAALPSGGAAAAGATAPDTTPRAR
ncbi:MAG: peptidylprolyl isomerase [Vicinamibacterales bacterium]